MSLKNRDIISIKDFSKDELLKVLDLAADIEQNQKAYSEKLRGTIMATLFFEPSTRTRFSTQSAVLRLGGQYIALSNPKSTSSMSKGETLYDTIRMVDGYCDVIAIRHPEKGSAQQAADAANVPVINCGDGAHEHPTQTLTDLYTIRKAVGKLDGLRIGFLGDLKYGRTVHSLATALSHFDAEMYFIAPESLQMPQDYLDALKEAGVTCHLDEDLLKVSKELDILYVTRIQKERFESEDDYHKVKGIYKITADFLQQAKEGIKIMHPLPRVDEIDPELDKFEQSIYFAQAHNGVYARQALFALVMGAVE